MTSKTITQVNHRETGNFGITRYAQELKKRIKYDQVIYGSKNLPSFVDYFFVLPMKVLFAKKTDVYHVSFPQGGLCLPIIKLFGKKTITTVQDINPVRKNQYHPLAPTVLSILLCSDKTIFISYLGKEDWNDYWLREGERRNDDSLYVIPCGIGEEFRKMQTEKHDFFRIGYVGNFKKHKNVDALVNAANIFATKCKDMELILIGDGAMQIRNNNEIQMSVFENVKNEDLAKIYNQFTVFVFPSLEEGFGLPILEAQACGLPVIVFKDSHIPEEVTKYCFKVKDIYEMVDCLGFLRESGYTESKEATAYAQSFNWDNVAKETEKLLKM